MAKGDFSAANAASGGAVADYALIAAQQLLISVAMAEIGQTKDAAKQIQS